MRLVVRDATRAGPRPRRRAGEVHVLAHSQGAAVATFTILEELEPAKFHLRRLTTVGAAVVLLGRETWPGRSTPYHPGRHVVEAEQRGRRRGERLAWENHWATWDPFSAGPIADRSTRRPRALARRLLPRGRDRRLRVPRSTRCTTRASRSSTTRSTTTTCRRSSNRRRCTCSATTIPHAPAAVGAARGPAGGDRQEVTHAQHVRRAGGRRDHPRASRRLARHWPSSSAFITVGVASIAGAVVGFFGGARGTRRRPARGSSPPTANGCPPAGGSSPPCSLFALLVWVSQRIQRRIYRSRVWERCPYDAKAWLTLTTIPRAAYVVGAAVAAWFAIREWATDDPQSLFWIALALLVVSGIPRRRAEVLAGARRGAGARFHAGRVRRSDRGAAACRAGADAADHRKPDQGRPVHGGARRTQPRASSTPRRRGRGSGHAGSTGGRPRPPRRHRRRRRAATAP